MFVKLGILCDGGGLGGGVWRELEEEALAI